ncbi:ArsR/SmtB family transcription factor [Natronorubrum sp. FCH18a]|uniref:ArsR/SmtB family transcription factor n=1 Tax=Natronorubrum sp. FCH18a TaxID=3447018 RepID=UPI003F5153CB
MRLSDEPDEDQAVPPDEFLELLGDRYARRILQLLCDEPMAARGIADAAEISEPTAYRRLDQLEAAGLVESELLLDSDGNHYRQFRTILERVTVRFGEDGPTISARTDRLESDHERARRNGPLDATVTDR